MRYLYEALKELRSELGTSKKGYFNTKEKEALDTVIKAMEHKL